jgi:CRP-like cAMP-binding protein
MGIAGSLGLHVSELTPVKFAPGDVVFRAGDPGETAFLVLDGEITISGRNARGQRVMLTKVTKGRVCGELGVLMGARRTADAVAVKGAVCAIIDNAALAKRLEQLDPFMRYWIEFMSDRLVELSKRAHD